MFAFIKIFRQGYLIISYMSKRKAYEPEELGYVPFCLQDAVRLAIQYNQVIQIYKDELNTGFVHVQIGSHQFMNLTYKEFAQEFAQPKEIIDPKKVKELKKKVKLKITGDN